MWQVSGEESPITTSKKNPAQGILTKESRKPTINHGGRHRGMALPSLLLLLRLLLLLLLFPNNMLINSIITAGRYEKFYREEFLSLPFSFVSADAAGYESRGFISSFQLFQSRNTQKRCHENMNECGGGGGGEGGGGRKNGKCRECNEQSRQSSQSQTLKSVPRIPVSIVTSSPPGSSSSSSPPPLVSPVSSELPADGMELPLPCLWRHLSFAVSSRPVSDRCVAFVKAITYEDVNSNVIHFA